MKEKLRILLVDDNPDDRFLIQRELKKEFGDVDIIHVPDKETFDYHIEKEDFNIVITDYRIRWIGGLEVLKIVKQRNPDIPVIMFTATGNQEVAVEAMKSGLDDYVIKSLKHLKRLPAVVRGVLEKVKRKKELREAEERYRSLFQNIPIGIYRTTPDGKILEVNPALVKMFGFSSVEELLGKNAEEFFVDLQDRKKALESLSGLGIVVNYETRQKTKDGRIIWVEDRARAIKDKNGRILYIEGSIIDITERKKAQEETLFALKKLQKVIEETIFALSDITEVRDPYTAGHQRRVADLALSIAQKMGLDDERKKALYYAGLIHDIGKIKIPSEVLLKPARLNKIEFSMIKQHPEVGYNVVKKIDFPWPIAEMILQHHENLDGSGYPQGLKGDEIILEARILRVADVVEAMTSHRPYRPAYKMEEALDELLKNKGKFYDQEVVEACLEICGNKPPFFN